MTAAEKPLGRRAMPQARPRAARDVVRAMTKELKRQEKAGLVRIVRPVDADGIISIDGKVDLPMLAYVADIALQQHFPSVDDFLP